MTLVEGTLPNTFGPLLPHDPQQAGPYRLLGRLGHGGQGIVYLGERGDGAQAAVKVVGIDIRHDPGAKQRFTAEIAAARRVDSFCTAKIYAADVDGDIPYVASEYITGPTLHRRVVQDRPLAGDELKRLAVGTATALTAIHCADVVHCDLKPANVILGPDGPRVIDFGIAQAIDSTHTATNLGTPAYMAPERFTGQNVGPPADLWAWAATIGFAACGRPPFGVDAWPAVMRRVLEDEPDLQGLSPSLERLLRDCLHKDPSARPTAQQVLLRLLGHPHLAREARDGAAAPTVAMGPVLKLGEDVAGGLTEMMAMTVPPPSWAERFRRHATDGPGLLFAAGFGAAGAAAGWYAMPAVLPAAGLGAAALLAAYSVRTIVAAVLD